MTGKCIERFQALEWLFTYHHICTENVKKNFCLEILEQNMTSCKLTFNIHVTKNNKYTDFPNIQNAGEKEMPPTLLDR